MTVLRSESREILNFCLLRETWTQRDISEQFGTTQVQASRMMLRWLDKGFIEKQECARGYCYRITDREEAQRLVSQKPGTRNGYVRVKDRPIVRAKPMINSVFALGL